nr:MAG TPA: hypothetical protein [Caudoviricetes sp.]
MLVLPLRSAQQLQPTTLLKRRNNDIKRSQN